MAADGANNELEEQLKDVGARLQEVPDDSEGLLKLLEVSLLSQLSVFHLFRLSFSVTAPFLGFVTVVVWGLDGCLVGGLIGLQLSFRFIWSTLLLISPNSS